MMRSLGVGLVVSGLAAAAACGLDLQADSTLEPDGGSSGLASSSSSSGEPGTSSSSSGEPGTSSSSGGTSSGEGPDAAPDAAVDPCTGAFTLGRAEVEAASPCEDGAYRCAGEARIEDGRIRLTSADPGAEQYGAFWRRISLGRNARFKIVATVSTRQRDEDGGGSNPGHGFGFALVQSNGDDGGGVFPDVAHDHPGQLGIARLPGFSGLAGYVKTYDDGVRGVFAARSSLIPSLEQNNLDNWTQGLGALQEFTRTEATFVRIELDGWPGRVPSIAVFRLDSVDDATPSFLRQFQIPAPEMDRFDYFGIGASRGNDGYSASAHRIESVSLSCPAWP